MSPPDDDRMSELRQLFFETADELVQKLNEEALQLEKTPADLETARSLRRTVHTLKGDAAACGFHELSELSHEFEDVLTLQDPDAAKLVPEIALRTADVFGALLHAYRTGSKIPNLQPLRSAIASLAKPSRETARAPIQSRTPTAGAKPAKSDRRTTTRTTTKTRTRASRTAAKSRQPIVRWSEYEQLAIAKALAEGARVQHVVVPIDPQCGMPIAGRQMVQLALTELGQVLAFYPAADSHEPIEFVEAALSSQASAEEVRVKCTIPTITLNVKVTAVRAPVASGSLPGAGSQLGADSKPERAPVEPAPVPSPVDKAFPEAFWGADEPVSPVLPSAPDHLLRVDTERIDNVLDLVGEMILAKSMLQQALLEFGQRFPRDVLGAKFADAMAFQARVLNDLQQSVMKIRMVPVDQLFRRFPRLVRDVARQCGKEVELMVRGGQTDLDKTILDAIAEPLTHLVRNAIGHGLEPAETRVRAGKPPQGTLRLGAYHQGNQVVIEVSDDGAGVDTGLVRQRAISQGLLDSEQAARLNESETLDLILRPGFSTATEITELSGRGVGLDVVQSVLGRLKGSVQIETTLGRGTTFRLRLPLTLAIIRALLFRVEQRLYALPLNAVAEISRTSEQDIRQVEQYEVLQLRDNVLPLLRLGPRPAPAVGTMRDKLFVLVINSGERKFGVVVDQLEGEEELVIKALDDGSITTDLVSGASILGDGRVVLILNMIALMERFTRGGADSALWRTTGLLSGQERGASAAGDVRSLSGAARGAMGART